MNNVKLSTLTREAAFEATGYSRNSLSGFYDYIYPASSYEGVFKLFKILITNFCQNSCLYCGIRARRTCQRYFLSPRELAAIFMQLHKARKADGIFISSGIYKNVDYSQRLILDTAYILRKKFNFPGYIHAKILPSADHNLIKNFSRLADRVSINLEAPTNNSLKVICPDKDFKEGILRPLKFISLLNQQGSFKSGITSQLVVGASGERDKDILSAASVLYNKFSLRRVYYSGFMPIKNTPLQNKKPVPFRRQLRLYQADILVRSYGFKLDELVFDREKNLPLDRDPKLSWAHRNMGLFPVNINKADVFLLKRVPGIGLKSIEKILRIRRQSRINSQEDLKKLGIRIQRAKNWIKFN